MELICQTVRLLRDSEIEIALHNFYIIIILVQDAPVCVFIHGGYWQEFHKDFSGFLVKLFVSKGIKVVIVGYDLCPQGIILLL